MKIYELLLVVLIVNAMTLILCCYCYY